MGRPDVPTIVYGLERELTAGIIINRRTPGGFMKDITARRLGVAIVGLGGAVATTIAAGLEMIRQGGADLSGLPLADADNRDLVPYRNINLAGWDLYSDDLAAAAKQHGVLGAAELDLVRPALEAIQPWPAVGNVQFCRNIAGREGANLTSLREQVSSLKEDLQRFRAESGMDAIVVVHLASTERLVDMTLPQFATPEAFEMALDADDPEIGPAMIYAYAAITSGIPYANFTPSVAADIPALKELARRRGVPIAGKDGKTGQTLVKTVIAPALRGRALRVDGWYSTNILGNRDGLALDDPNSLASKLDTKGSVLDSILGYKVENHKVFIHYYPPRGDDKEAWDNIDLTGFLGHRMQLKVNFLCKDSILAAPLVIEIARCLDLAHQRGEGGVLEPLAVFFKAPLTRNGGEPEHAWPDQERRFRSWLDGKAERTTQALKAAAASFVDAD
jgi:myo-inositol-1-phosphate synthase